MKLKISERKQIKLPEKKITLTPKGAMPGPNDTAIRKKMLRDRGLPLSAPGTGQRSELVKIRKNGDIPAIIYSLDKENKAQSSEMIAVKGGDTEDAKGLLAVLREIKKDGYIATTIFELDDGTRVRKAIVKDITYNKIGYAIQHIDFLCVDDNKPVTLNVPVQIVGAAESKGVKAGGFVRTLMRSMKVTCAPKDIPKSIVVDITDLDMPVTKAPDAVHTGTKPVTSRIVADVKLPNGVTSLVGPKAIVTMIAKK